MTRSSSIVRKHGSDRGDYGFARARDIAFDAVLALWRKRKAAGVKQSDIAAALGRDPAWVSKQLKGPGNWTLRTIGELVEAMDGELEIAVFGRDEKIMPAKNADAYSGYGDNWLSGSVRPIVGGPLGIARPQSITNLLRPPALSPSPSSRPANVGTTW